MLPLQGLAAGVTGAQDVAGVACAQDHPSLLPLFQASWGLPPRPWSALGQQRTLSWGGRLTVAAGGLPHQKVSRDHTRGHSWVS